MKVYLDEVQLPNGGTIPDYSVVTLPSGVIVVATDTEGKLITQYEYKYAINKTILNLPSGGVEDGLSVLENAKKELLEETGYASDEVELIADFYEYPSKADHHIYIVRIKNAHKIKEPEHETTENISPVRLISPNETSKDKFDTTYAVSALAAAAPEFLSTLI